MKVYFDTKLQTNNIWSRSNFTVSRGRIKQNIYHANFSSHLTYGSQIWTQRLLSVSDKVTILQNSAVRIMKFSDFRSHTAPLFKELKILKFSDNIVLKNCMFVYDYLCGNLPKSFDGVFTSISETHSFNTCSAMTGMLVIPRSKGMSYGVKSIYSNCINSWNLLTLELNNQQKRKTPTKYIEFDLKSFTKSRLKDIITNYLFSSNQ